MNPVLITRSLPPPVLDLLLAAGHRADVLAEDNPPERAALLGAVAGRSAVIATLVDRIDGELLAAAGSSLRVVANYAVGFDNISLAECTARGVRATNTPGVLTEATADLAWALILSTARRVGEGERLVRSGGWSGWAPRQLLGLELRGATLGVVGAGRIGTAVARRATGFGMRVLYAHPRRNAEIEACSGATFVGLDTVITESDVVSLHVPMRTGNKHLIDRRRLAALKPTAILINTSRGPVVDEAALVEALRKGAFAGAGLDVYEQEPRLAPGLAELPNVVVLPHLGSATHATRRRMSEMVAENVIAVLAGKDPPNPVN